MNKPELWCIQFAQVAKAEYSKNNSIFFKQGQISS